MAVSTRFPQGLAAAALFCIVAPSNLACVAQRLALPRLVVDRPPAELPHVKLELTEFRVSNVSESDQAQDGRRAIERAFIGYLNQSLHLASLSRPIGVYSRRDPDAVELEVDLDVHETANRTIILDGIFFYPFLGSFPLTPLWGDATVELVWRIRHHGAAEGPFKVKVEAPYTVLVYSYYRTGPIEEAFRRGHETAFKELVDRLQARLALAPSPDSPAPDLTPREIRLRPVGVGVVTEPFQDTEPPGFLKRYFGALGGLEASLTGGSATVESTASARSGAGQLVASGNARSHGYRFSLYKPPSESGFFFPPALGFFSQTIDIAGFRQDVPLFVPRGTTAIPAMVSDPTTGAPVDLSEPIAYRLDLKSAYVGQGIGLNMVIGAQDVQFFSTARAGLNVAEYRHSDVTLYQSRVKGGSFALFQSGQLGAQVGFSFPAIHFAVRAAVEYEWFRAFSYPQPIEFLAAAAYNDEKKIYERQRVFVSGASLSTLDWQLSAVMLF